MRLIAPEMKLFQNQMATAQKAGNYKEMNESRDKLSRVQERYGVSSATSAVAILQMPFLITWFLSVRYMSMSPELFPGMLDGGFGWMINLTEHDPYFLTPFISACFSSLNISVNIFCGPENKKIVLASGHADGRGLAHSKIYEIYEIHAVHGVPDPDVLPICNFFGFF
jgi:hypothetical protein